MRVHIHFDEPGTLPEQRVQLYQHKDDLGVLGRLRLCVPCPCIFPMSGDAKTEITEQWQYYMRAINYGMSVQHVAALFGWKKAFTNRQDEVRADWLRRKDLDKDNPDFDKVRTTALSVMTGVEAGSLLKVTMLDGNKPPPLKPGRSYPKSVSQINPDDYLYLPRTHRHLFCVANIVNVDGEYVPWDNGAVYDWIGDGRPYTFFPHVSRFDVYYPLKYLIKLPAGSQPPSPYLFIPKERT